MKKTTLFLALLTLVICNCKLYAQQDSKPKLVVGIVVDQMRYDYLTRFDKHYSDEGFKRLISQGFQYHNTHFNYIPTYTGPGHASVYTGATPQSHGIISNNWYNKFEKKDVYCAGDSTVSSVGTSSDAGKMSPHRLKATTLTDQNRLHTQMQGKTIGVAIKDRGSILPAGHTANAAYWFHGREEGKWITSSYYMEELPAWVQEFNASNKIKRYLKTWDTALPINQYQESGPDDTSFEGGFKGKEKTTFPYDLAALNKQNGGYDILKATPYGNSLTTDFAIEALKAEKLGKDNHTDFLTISYSSTDYIGHNFGVNSKEVQDTYIRLDKDIARLLKTLDEEVGENNYTVFVTSDHGAVNVPAYLKSKKIPSGYFDARTFKKDLDAFVSKTFGSNDLIEDVSNYQVFFNYEVLTANNIDTEALQKAIKHFVLQYNQVDKVFTRAQLEQGTYSYGVASRLQKGFHQKRSGDVFIILDPAVITYSKTGSTHGSGLSYDTHAPLIFYGNGVKQGASQEYATIPDIAPTIAALLGIEFPNGMTGTVLTEVFKN